MTYHDKVNFIFSAMIFHISLDVLREHYWDQVLECHSHWYEVRYRIDKFSARIWPKPGTDQRWPSSHPNRPDVRHWMVWMPSVLWSHIFHCLRTSPVWKSIHRPNTYHHAIFHLEIGQFACLLESCVALWKTPC